MIFQYLITIIALSAEGIKALSVANEIAGKERGGIFCNNTFRILDKNNDGAISENEFRHVILMAMQNRRHHDIQSAGPESMPEFSSVDKNSDGSLDHDELCSYLSLDDFNLNKHSMLSLKNMTRGMDTLKSKKYAKRMYMDAYDKICPDQDSAKAWTRLHTQCNFTSAEAPQDLDALVASGNCKIFDCTSDYENQMEKKLTTSVILLSIFLLFYTMLVVFAAFFFITSFAAIIGPGAAFAVWKMALIPASLILFAGLLVGEILIFKKMIHDATILHLLDK